MIYCDPGLFSTYFQKCLGRMEKKEQHLFGHNSVKPDFETVYACCEYYFRLSYVLAMYGKT